MLEGSSWRALCILHPDCRPSATATLLIGKLLEGWHNLPRSLSACVIAVTVRRAEANSSCGLGPCRVEKFLAAVSQDVTSAKALAQRPDPLVNLHLLEFVDSGSSLTRTPGRAMEGSSASELPNCLALQDAKSKLREIAEKRAEDVEEVMAHLEKTLLLLGL